MPCLWGSRQTYVVSNQKTSRYSDSAKVLNDELTQNGAGGSKQTKPQKHNKTNGNETTGQGKSPEKLVSNTKPQNDITTSSKTQTKVQEKQGGKNGNETTGQGKSPEKLVSNTKPQNDTTTSSKTETKVQEKQSSSHSGILKENITVHKTENYETENIKTTNIKSNEKSVIKPQNISTSLQTTTKVQEEKDTLSQSGILKNKSTRQKTENFDTHNISTTYIKNNDYSVSNGSSSEQVIKNDVLHTSSSLTVQNEHTHETVVKSESLQTNVAATDRADSTDSSTTSLTVVTESKSVKLDHASSPNPKTSQASIAISITASEDHLEEETQPSVDETAAGNLTVPQTSSRNSLESNGSSQDDRKDSMDLSAEGQSSSNDKSTRRRSGVQISMPEVVLEGALPVYAKSTEDQDKIRQAIEKNDFVSKVISGKPLTDIINAMQVKRVSAKQKIIKQGDKGSEMYVSKEGKFRIKVKGKLIGEFDDIRVFGELAILYNPKRLATVQAVTDATVWVLTREVYQQIVISHNLKEQDENLNFLRNVAYLNTVDERILRQVSNLLKPEFFPSSSVIIRQGDKGDKFYIIRAGTVTISKTGEGVLGKLGKGQCFGEMALQKEDTRQATVTAEAPGVDCLTLTRADFINHFGDVEIPKIEVSKTSFKAVVEAEYQDIVLTDLKLRQTLGVGGFGRVELVSHKKKKDLVFALKYLKKIEIVKLQQVDHVRNEKIIQMNCKSPFIVRLYRTFKDAKYVYFLMEACLGGDLFSLIHKQKGKRFEEKDAKFYTACVLEALEYLHSKGIIYRDLKPENLTIDNLGYLKLTDFGFAKLMPARGKTYTFAGTPEYVAPEIVLNRGHDRSVDYWAFGVLVYELLTGRTPFKTGDTSYMRTYNKILNGIINFPSYVNPKPKNLIEKLCRPAPVERLGMQRGGPRDIKAHKWYQDFDWDRFIQRQIPAPIKPKIKSALDASNFDEFKPDKDYPPDETSGWDVDF
ncbi:cGMP-dependent protein kinase 1-like isoform X3 [Sitophilus oryzae]|uniref:cGMP-dependent protein kinase n=1 Tax=Sitophilus oryzae TaxID=7048 RepID=A0A6J2XCW2_SITOR|nr:cGMP-dependent protein kinase 1-like isoform X2 [Sitophilus oryzae]XP_030748986.1 cGMP-dependent protein kinase 1-like isoform X3 [Sitophilus oryzae]